MPFAERVIDLFKRRRPPANTQNAEYDLAAINNRLYRAMYLLGRTRVELAEHFGLDTSLPLCRQSEIPQASTENIIKAANFLGVSVGWLTTGEARTTVDHYVCAADDVSAGSTAAAMAANTGHSSAVVQGAQNTSVIIKNFHGDLTEWEWEFLTRYRALSAPKQAEVWACILDLGANMNEGIENAPRQ